MLTINPILRTDSYKFSHYKQYPPGTQSVSGYIESRGVSSKWLAALTNAPNIPFFGLKPFLESLKTPITKEDIDEAESFVVPHGLPFNREGWEKLVKNHRGDLPIAITALKEGTIVKPGVPMVQVHSTDPEFHWLTTYVEMALVRAIWYPTTVATISRRGKEIIYGYLQETADDPDAEIGFKLHDFGGRGVSSGESAMLGGMAHLVNFMGTDTVEALVGCRRYYGEHMAGFSIPASEHSTITSWGEDHEMMAHSNMIDTFMSKPGMVASVSDSYNIYRACEYIWGGGLKDKVQRYGERGGCIVVRPDSGDPVNVTLGVITRLADAFGCTTNKKGYKVLPPYIRIIQGDGVDLTSIPRVLDNFKEHGFSASNIAFGMGGGLLQHCDRDTLKFAMKANEVTVNGEKRDVYKAPIHDTSKSSKRGRQAVVFDNNDRQYHAIREDELGHSLRNELELVYKNGQFFRDENFADIRARAAL